MLGVKKTQAALPFFSSLRIGIHDTEKKAALFGRILKEERKWRLFPSHRFQYIQDMALKWYIVHTYSGYEQTAKTALESRVKAMSKEEEITEVLIPSEKVVEMVKGEKRTSTRKFFPGYILVKMELNNETWHIVKNTPKVTGFVGGSTNPPALSDGEVSEIVNQIEDGTVKPKPKVTFEKGDAVTVTDGPFATFTGYVEEVYLDKGKVKVMVSIFGRPTPVELEFFQVKKG